jgi:hypothetical protein
MRLHEPFNDPNDARPWTRPALYRVQCYTANLARELVGNHGDVTRVSDWDHSLTHDPLFTFRALPPYRSAPALELRHDVAQIVKQRRRGNCGECGERWPCSDSRRTDIAPWIVAHHYKGDRHE